VTWNLPGVRKANARCRWVAWLAGKSLGERPHAPGQYCSWDKQQPTHRVAGLLSAGREAYAPALKPYEMVQKGSLAT
jgi:hypothetical protein